jgi:SHS2 domain-containing protein
MGFEYLDHTADLAVRAWGSTAGEAFAEAGLGLVGAMVRLDQVRPAERRAFSLRNSSLALLLVDWLSAIVAEKDTSGLVFTRMTARVSEEAGESRLEAEAWGEPLDPSRHRAMLEVKGISLLGLSVRVEGALWVARYVADV